MMLERVMKPDVLVTACGKNIAPETQQALVDLSRAALRMMRLEREIENEEETLP